MYSEKDRKKVLELRAQGVSNPKISEQMGMSISTVNRIINIDRLMKQKSEGEIQSIDKMDYNQKISPRENTKLEIKKIIEKLESEKDKSYENQSLIKNFQELLTISKNNEKEIINKTKLEDDEYYKELLDEKLKEQQDKYEEEINSLNITYKNEVNSLKSEIKDLNETIDFITERQKEDSEYLTGKIWELQKKLISIRDTVANP